MKQQLCWRHSCCWVNWFEMRARGGANDAIRSLLILAPPRAVVIRDGEPVEAPTSEVTVGDLLLIRPGAKVPGGSTSACREGSLKVIVAS